MPGGRLGPPIFLPASATSRGEAVSTAFISSMRSAAVTRPDKVVPILLDKTPTPTVITVATKVNSTTPHTCSGMIMAMYCDSPAGGFLAASPATAPTA